MTPVEGHMYRDISLYGRQVAGRPACLPYLVCIRGWGGPEIGLRDPTDFDGWMIRGGAERFSRPMKVAYKQKMKSDAYWWLLFRRLMGLTTWFTQNLQVQTDLGTRFRFKDQSKLYFFRNFHFFVCPNETQESYLEKNRQNK